MYETEFENYNDLLKVLVGELGENLLNSLDFTSFAKDVIGILENLVFIKDTPNQTTVKGYMCNFRLKAPIALMKIAYLGGFGVDGSHGFGCLLFMYDGIR